MIENQIEKLRDLLKKFTTAVLITHDAAAEWPARPMAVARVEENGNLWFITGEHSAKVHEIEAEARVQVICQDGWNCCVAITGRASLVRDRVRIRELWKPAFQAWFPEGAEDPGIVLIHVVGERGEYWDSTGINRLTYLYQSFKAILQGTTPELKQGEQHGKVTLEVRPAASVR